MCVEILAGRDIWLVSIKPQFLAGPILNRLQSSQIPSELATIQHVVVARKEGRQALAACLPSTDLNLSTRDCVAIYGQVAGFNTLSRLVLLPTPPTVTHTLGFL
jgi:hypothetical protein